MGVPGTSSQVFPVFFSHRSIRSAPLTALWPSDTPCAPGSPKNCGQSAARAGISSTVSDNTSNRTLRMIFFIALDPLSFNRYII